MKNENESIFSNNLLLWLILLSLPGSAAVMSGLNTIFLWIFGIIAGIALIIYVLYLIGSKSSSQDKKLEQVVPNEENKKKQEQPTFIGILFLTGLMALGDHGVYSSFSSGVLPSITLRGGNIEVFGPIMTSIIYISGALILTLVWFLVMREYFSKYF